MLNRLNNRDRSRLARVKACPCSVCGAAGPSEAHHIKQGQQMTCVALCADCHRGSHNGWHGRRALSDPGDSSKVSEEVARLSARLDQLARAVDALQHRAGAPSTGPVSAGKP